jgi:transposase InsO family protein
MQLWQMDVMAGVMLEDATELEVVTGVDDHSRFCIATGLVRRATSKAVCDVLAASLHRFGIPDEILTDNGKVFTGRFGPQPVEVLFDRICRENGIAHRHTAVRCPTTTGKIERFHQTLRKEFLADRTFPSIEHAQAELDAWVVHYNTARPHQALEMATPADRFRLAPSPPTRSRSRSIPPRTIGAVGAPPGRFQQLRLGRQPALLRGKRLPSRARGRLRRRDCDPGLEQEPPDQDDRP